MHCKKFGGKNFCFKVPNCEIFDLDFRTPINPIWVGDLGNGKKVFIFKIGADIRLYVFLTHAECALNNVLHMLSIRKN